MQELERKDGYKIKSRGRQCIIYKNDEQNDVNKSLYAYRFTYNPVRPGDNPWRTVIYINGEGYVDRYIKFK